MSQSNYQEPIEKEDLDLAKKLRTGADQPLAGAEKAGQEPEKIEIPSAEKIPEVEIETGKEAKPEEVSEKIETARKTIQVQKPAAVSGVAADAQAVSQITEYEKKVEKLVELALQRGPEHAVRVAQHIDKGKSVSQANNYTLDEVHDRLLENELRRQLIAKGLLREL